MCNTCIKCWPRLLNWCVLWRVCNENRIFTIRQEKSRYMTATHVERAVRWPRKAVRRRWDQAQAWCLRGDIPKRTITSKGMGAGLCVVLAECVTLKDGPRSQTTGENCGMVRSISMSHYGQFWLLEVNDFTEHPGQSIGVLPFPLNAAKSIRIPRTFSKTCIITLYGHRCLTIAPSTPWNLSSILQVISWWKPHPS